MMFSSCIFIFKNQNNVIQNITNDNFYMTKCVNAFHFENSFIYHNESKIKIVRGRKYFTKVSV